MIKVKMLKTMNGSQDGITVDTFVKDKEYLVSDALLEAFISDGAVELVENKPKPEENKAVQSAPENKKKKK